MSITKRKSVISLILRVGAKPLENGLIPPLDGSDGDVGVRVPEFYMCVDKAVRVLLLGGSADNSSKAGSGDFYSNWVRSDSAVMSASLPQLSLIK